MRRYLLLLPVLMAGCAPATHAPSLALRAAEAIDPRVPVPDPQLPTVADPGLSAQLSALFAQAEAGHARFNDAAPSAWRAADSVGARQSESWIAAQQVLSALVARRGAVTRALGDIDALGAARIQRLGGIAQADMRAIEAAAGRVAEIDRAEAALIDQLQARLR